jgi:HAD superfamily phosphoserine phosphatase-like hydrolase
MSKEVEAIILDVDGTLSEEISWLKITQGLGAPPTTHADIFAQFKQGKLSYPQAKEKLIRLWQNTGNANRDFMEKMFRSWDLKKDAPEIVDYLKRAYRLCLISGAVDLYVQIVAEKLGVADWYANTELIWNKKGELIDFNYDADQAGKKLRQFQEFSKHYGIPKEKCAVVGDGDTDIILFRELPCGIAVNKNPCPELEALAHQTVKELSELKQIF